MTLDNILHAKYIIFSDIYLILKNLILIDIGIPKTSTPKLLKRTTSNCTVMFSSLFAFTSYCYKFEERKRMSLSIPFSS